MPVELQVTRPENADDQRTRRELRQFDPREPQPSGSNAAIVKVALIVGALASLLAITAGRPRPVVSASAMAATNGVAPEDAQVIPDIGHWSVMKPADLSLNFGEWLRAFGAEPKTKIELDANGFGDPSGAAYLLLTTKSNLKRVVWIADHRVVCDVVDKIQGIARIPAGTVSRIAWSANARPAETADGDGLMIIRDYTQPNGVTAFFVKNGRVYSGVPENLPNVELR